MAGHTLTALIAAVTGVADAGHALAAGADRVDVSGCPPDAAAAIRAAYPASVLWEPNARILDADRVAAACTQAGDLAPDPPAAAVVAVAALGAWLGAPAVRSSRVREVRRAIDMTASIAGRRPPALTIRGLA